MRRIPLSDGMERLAQAVAERVVNLVVEAIDVDALVQRVDVDRIVERVDVNAVVSRVDVDAVVSRVDIDALLQRVDVNAVVAKVDVNSIVDQLDIDALVEHTELGALIAKGTTGVFTEVLDLLRSQGVGLDDFVARWSNRLLRRDPATLPQGPRLLMQEALPPAGSTVSNAEPGPAR